MTQDEMRAIILSFPGVEEGTSYGRPAFKVKGKFFTRLRAEDDSLVLMEVGPDEREMLMEADTETFFLHPHYRNHDLVLVRAGRIDPDWARPRLIRDWRAAAPKRWLKEWDAAHPLSSV